MTNNLCDLPGDIFFDELIGKYDNIFKAIELINVCDRKDELLDNNKRFNNFILHFRDNILSLEYSKLIKLFSRNRDLFESLWSSSSFWKKKMKIEKRNKNTGDFLIYSAKIRRIF